MAVKELQPYIGISFLVLHSSASDSVKCLEGSSVGFDHPCPAQLHSCDFKKLFGEKSSIIDPRFAMNDENTHIILKKCLEDDDGTYLWVCKGCENKQFHLEVMKEKRESLQCKIGGKVSFKFNCSEDLKLCSFEKLFPRANILVKGFFSDKYPRYQLGEAMDDVALTECKDGDAGMYTWKCEGCKVISRFNLTVVIGKGISVWNPSIAILLILAVIFAHQWKT